MTIDLAPERSTVERATIRRITRRIMPFLIVLYLINFLDRTNVGFAASGMEADLGLDAAAYGLGAGIFFIAYFLFEVPSNVALHRFGARVWIARIMVTWGIVAGLLAFIQTPAHFYVLRFLLGAAEAGFYPGIIFYLSLWFPARYRARMTSIFLLGIPIAQVIGAPLSTSLIQLGDAVGVSGWRFMYAVEALPAIALGIVTFFYLTDRPALAKWLPTEERDWLVKELADEESAAADQAGPNAERGKIGAALRDRRVWALAAILFCMTSGSNALNFFLPSIVETFQKTFDVPAAPIVTGLIVAVPYAFAAAAMLLWSRHSDKHLERRWHTACPAALAGIAIIIALLLNNPVAVVIGFIVLASGLYSAQIVFWSTPATILTGAGAAAGIGLINSVANLSGFVGPYFTGATLKATGSYTPAFIAIGVLVIIGALGFAILGRRLPSVPVAEKRHPTAQSSGAKADDTA